MFDHITLRAADRAESERFYRLVLAELSVEATHADDELVEWSDFSLMQATRAQPATHRLHVGFAAPSCEAVDEFWRAGTDAGYLDDGRPGPRPRYGDDYYGGFLRDPDGNSAEAVHHDSLRQGGVVDHLWIRVSDLERSGDFYALVAKHGGFDEDERPGRRQFRGESGSFSILQGAPTEQLHLAFATADDGTVETFHRVAIAAGHSDNGGPGERPQYHPGYYAAFVLDPDGNNVELVNHHR